MIGVAVRVHSRTGDDLGVGVRPSARRRSETCLS